MTLERHPTIPAPGDLSRTPPHQVALLLHEHLLASLRRAQMAIEGGALDLQAPQLDTARRALAELVAAIDRGQGAAEVGALRAVYDYFASELRDMGRAGTVERLECLTVMVQDLRDGLAATADAGTGAGSGGDDAA